MKIKKKIAVWSLLCALLVGLVPTCSAHAEENIYTLSEWCADNGVLCIVSPAETQPTDSVGYYTDEVGGFETVLFCNEDGGLVLLRIEEHGRLFVRDDTLYLFNDSTETSRVEWRKWVHDGNGWLYDSSARSSVAKGSYISLLVFNACRILYSDSDIYCTETEEEIYFSKSIAPTLDSGDTNDRAPTTDRTETNVDLGVDLGEITLDEIPEVIKNIKDSIEEFFGLVGVVPLMIGSIFGFLPDWCLWVLGVSFAFVGILLVFKLIRG